MSYLCAGERTRAAQGGTNEERPLGLRNVLMYGYVSWRAWEMAVGVRSIALCVMSTVLVTCVIRTSDMCHTRNSDMCDTQRRV